MGNWISHGDPTRSTCAVHPSPKPSCSKLVAAYLVFFYFSFAVMPDVSSRVSLCWDSRAWLILAFFIFGLSKVSYLVFDWATHGISGRSKYLFIFPFTFYRGFVLYVLVSMVRPHGVTAIQED